MSNEQSEEVLLKAHTLLTVQEVASVLHISRSLIYMLVRDGDLVAVRIGRAVRFLPEDVRDYLRRRAAWMPAAQRRRKQNLP